MGRFYKYLILSALLSFSCGTPNDPEEIISGDGGYKIISKFMTPGYAQDVIVEDTIAYLAQGEGGLLIVNIADPLNPKEVAIKNDSIKGYSFKLAKKDTIIYVAAGNFGVSTVNVADPYNPTVPAFHISINGAARDLIVFENYLFTSIGELGVNISEISYPPIPDIRGDMNAPGYARGLCTTPDSKYLMVACGEMGVVLLNISQMQNGFGEYPQAGWTDTRGYTMDITCHPELPYAYAACGTGGLVIIDYSDTLNVHIVGEYDTRGYAKEIEYSDNKIYLTTETRGLQIFDVSNVSSPVKIGTVNTEYALGLWLDEKYIYVADQSEGLIIISKP